MRNLNRRYWRSLLLMMVLAVGAALSWAGSVPSFTLVASNTTTSASGSGSIPYTLTSINGYSGTLVLGCSAVNAPAAARVPVCTTSATTSPAVIEGVQLTAGEVLNKSLPIYYGIVPASSASRQRGLGAERGLWLAGALLLGVGLRRRAGWLKASLLAVFLLVGMGAITACGGSSSNGPSAGAYSYLVSATDLSSKLSASTKITVTVP